MHRSLNSLAIGNSNAEPEAHPLAVYKLSRATKKDLERRFTYHAPVAGQVKRYEELRDIALGYAITVCQLCPENRERSLALTALDLVVAHANASIARGES